MLSKLDKSWTIKLRVTVNNSTLYYLYCPLTVFNRTSYYRIFVKEIRDKKTKKLISKSPDKTEENIRVGKQMFLFRFRWFTSQKI